MSTWRISKLMLQQQLLSSTSKIKSPLFTVVDTFDGSSNLRTHSYKKFLSKSRVMSICSTHKTSRENTAKTTTAMTLHCLTEIYSTAECFLTYQQLMIALLWTKTVFRSIERRTIIWNRTTVFMLSHVDL
jgi:hypothetical protein